MWLSHTRRRVVDAELTSGLRNALGTEDEWSSGSFTVLVRVHSHPIGLVDIDDPGSPAADVPAQVYKAVGDALRAHLLHDGLPDMTAEDLWEPWPSADDGHPCLTQRRLAEAHGPFTSVVIATRDRTVELARCLDSLLAMDYPRAEIVVVDNAPSGRETEHLVARRYGGAGVRYVREDRPGLANAHNAGLHAARGDLIAFTDDDVVADCHWLTELVVPFVVHPEVAGATGFIAPAELDTPTQVMLHRHGNYAKGFATTLRDLDAHRPADPLFPFAAGQLGSGANMAFTAEYLRSAGGFDPATGTGTPARGGDDLLAFFRLVMAGRTLAYRPGAVVWHYHRRDPAAIRRQVYGYGVGLGAYLAGAAAHEPRAMLSMLRLIPAGLAHMNRSHDDGGRQPVQWPAELARLERWGMLVGPAAYVASRAKHRRARTGLPVA